jgi:tRNA dimethylallyltransferase
MQSEGRIDLPFFPEFQSSAANSGKYSSHVPILIVIGGPTATGKTGLAIALAHRLNSLVLSADSRQIYRGFDIGTAKPTAAEQAQVPHHLIDLCEPTTTLTLAQYQRAAQTLIQQGQQQGSVPLLVGGTGLYIEAVVKGLRIPPVAPQLELRSQLQALGQIHCYQLLQQVDAIAASHIHAHDSVRTQRALEVFYVTGQPISSLQGEQPPNYPVLQIALDCAASTLAERISERTQQMLELGLAAETEQLLQCYGPDLPLLKTLGYAEMVQHLQGQLDLAATAAAIVTSTRQFAKRQRTWFRNRATPTWFDAAAPDLVDQVWDHVGCFLAATAGLSKS